MRDEAKGHKHERVFHKSFFRKHSPERTVSLANLTARFGNSLVGFTNLLVGFANPLVRFANPLVGFSGSAVKAVDVPLRSAALS